MRHNEKVDLRAAGLAQSLAIACAPVVPVVAAVFTFLGLILSGGDLLASDAFSAITVFFVMIFGIRMIPYGTRYCAEALVALRRIQEIFLLPEYDQQIPVCKDANIAIHFKNATFLWDEKGRDFLRFSRFNQNLSFFCASFYWDIETDTIRCTSIDPG
ncbi:unnamed protein product [Gongylonema pulchrum]|uniref:ABC transmembrane type-1 domain-containing protein n=1 Tax=Gongylonema pulchrum TaxID=637853 RepID=A0A183F018_9BILA|nr:unnamed protein product [Gongylonema pulchrum]